MPDREYDVFENLPDGQKRWRCCVHGIAAAREAVEKFGNLTTNEVIAICISNKRDRGACEPEGRKQLIPKLPAGRTPKRHRTLLLENFLHLADFLLDFAAYLFVLALDFQIGVVYQSSCILFDLTLHFVNLARYLILCTWFHLSPSFARFGLRSFFADIESIQTLQGIPRILHAA
jgi:hypothetical protein